MPTIAAGASSTVTIAEGQSLIGSGQGTAVVGPGPQAGQQIGLQGFGWRVGPFGRAQAVYITANSTISYEESSSSAGAVPGAGISAVAASRDLTAA